MGWPCVVRVSELEDAVADHLGFIEPEQPTVGGVDPQKSEVRRGQCHRHRAIVEGGPESFLALAQGFLSSFALGDVKADADDIFDRPCRVEEGSVVPGDQPAAAISGDPIVFVLLGELCAW